MEAAYRSRQKPVSRSSRPEANLQKRRSAQSRGEAAIARAKARKQNSSRPEANLPGRSIRA
ncbi:hypothetical protein KCP77_15305 [Salmonella enterica subsp. enterica]|nr:hypothetical protein KCP77_15305 [Salmonella enterica subsp. enterica]